GRAARGAGDPHLRAAGVIAMTSLRASIALAELARVAPSRVVGDASVRVSDVYQDSRKVVPGSLFVVRRGEKSDGAAFVADAIRPGAVALMTDDAGVPIVPSVPTLVAADLRAAIGIVANEVYGRPFDALTAVGITGTNGKTTTATLTGHLLRSLGH